MTASSQTAHSPSTTAQHPPRVSTLVTATVRAAVLALVANLVIQVVARIAGIETVLTPPGSAPVQIQAFSIVTMTLAPLVVGGILLVVLARVAPGAARSLPWVGLVVGVGTAVMPLSMGGDLASRLVLALMHVVTGVAWFVSVRRTHV